jgi:hypothetical protein
VVYSKFTGQKQPAAAHWIQASQRLVYVSQKCSELPPERLTPANLRVTPTPSTTCSPCTCSSRRRGHPNKELPSARSGRDLRPSLLLVLRRGGSPGSRSGPPRQVHAQRPHGIQLGRQRLHHQRGSARCQRSYRVLIPSLAPASLILRISQPIGFSLPRGTSTHGAALMLLSGSQNFRRAGYTYDPESCNI